MNKDQLNLLSQKVIGIAIEIHKNLGPGFLEKYYGRAFAIELTKNKVKFTQEKSITVKYKDCILGKQRIDFLIDDELIIELKCAVEINAAHKAQLLSYLKVIDKRLGLILNFSKEILDIKRIVNKL